MPRLSFFVALFVLVSHKERYQFAFFRPLYPLLEDGGDFFLTELTVHILKPHLAQGF
jgi:hypothetical protein